MLGVNVIAGVGTNIDWNATMVAGQSGGGPNAERGYQVGNFGTLDPIQIRDWECNSFTYDGGPGAPIFALNFVNGPSAFPWSEYTDIFVQGDFGGGVEVRQWLTADFNFTPDLAGGAANLANPAPVPDFQNGNTYTILMR